MVVIMIEYLEYFPLLKSKEEAGAFPLFLPSPWADDLSRELIDRTRKWTDNFDEVIRTAYW